MFQIQQYNDLGIYMKFHWNNMRLIMFPINVDIKHYFI